MKNKRCIRLLIILVALFFGLYPILGCNGGGGSSGGGGNGGGGGDDPPPDTWEQISIKQITGGGLLSPHIKASVDNDDNIHIMYFDDNDTGYGVNHIIWDMEALTGNEDESVATVDNCSALAFTLDGDNYPIIAYQGGLIKDCGGEDQSDAMFSIKENDVWGEYTGAMGVVERNPVFRDGLAGSNMSIAVDSQGSIHLCYQFRYEGCDAMNFQYPDLWYVKRDRNDIDNQMSEADWIDLEEQIEGNIYNENGTGYQNSVGYHNVMVLDNNEDPVVFYYTVISDTKGLRVALRQNEEWTTEWIETGCEVGDISAISRQNGDLAVAYYVEVDDDSDDSHYLKYAEKESQSTSWDVSTVDDGTWCGQYCSLAFNSSGLPAIAYYDIKSYSGYDRKNLKLASFDGVSWDKETVESSGNIGLYNSLWFDADNRAFICSYSETYKTIYIFYK